MKGRVIRGVGAGALGQLISLVGRLALVPLYLYSWGQDLYAHWILLSAVVTYLSLADLGGQQYIAIRLTALRASGDRSEFDTTFQTALVLYALVSFALVVLLALALLLLSFLPYENWWQGDTWDSRIALGILGTSVVLSLPLGLMLGVYRANGHIATSAMLTNALLMAQIVLQALVLLAGGGFVAAAGAHLLPQLVLMLFLGRDLPMRYRDLDFFSMEKVDLGYARQFIRPSLDFFKVQMAFMLSMQGLILVVGAIGSAAEVVFFYAARTAANIVKQLLGVISHSVTPEFTRLHTLGSLNLLALTFSVSVQVSIVLAVAAALVIISFGEQIFGMWLGPDVAYDAVVVYLLFVWTGLSVYVYSAINLLLSMKEQRTVSRILLASTIIGLFLSYILGTFHGIYGVIVGIALADVLLLMIAIQIHVTRCVPIIDAGVAVKAVVPAFAILVIYRYSMEFAVLLFAAWLVVLIHGYKNHFSYSELMMLIGPRRARGADGVPNSRK